MHVAWKAAYRGPQAHPTAASGFTTDGSPAFFNELRFGAFTAGQNTVLAQATSTQTAMRLTQLHTLVSGCEEVKGTVALTPAHRSEPA